MGAFLRLLSEKLGLRKLGELLLIGLAALASLRLVWIWLSPVPTRFFIEWKKWAIGVVWNGIFSHLWDYLQAHSAWRASSVLITHYRTVVGIVIFLGVIATIYAIVFVGAATRWLFVSNYMRQNFWEPLLHTIADIPWVSDVITTGYTFIQGAIKLFGNVMDPNSGERPGVPVLAILGEGVAVAAIQMHALPTVSYQRAGSGKRGEAHLVDVQVPSGGPINGQWYVLDKSLVIPLTKFSYRFTDEPSNTEWSPVRVTTAMVSTKHSARAITLNEWLDLANAVAKCMVLALADDPADTTVPKFYSVLGDREVEVQVPQEVFAKLAGELNISPRGIIL